MDRTKAVAYAQQHWFRPTDDHLVWTESEAIDVRVRKQQLLAKKQIEPDWEPVFLRYDAINKNSNAPEGGDGLFFVAPAHFGVDFFETSIPSNERVLSQGWFGPGRDGVPGSPGGLNDCTAYVSHCLVAGGVTGLGPSAPGQIWPTRDPVQLYRLKDRPSSEVKILTDGSDVTSTEQVFQVLSHVIKPTDVLTFGADGHQQHSGMLVTVDSTTGAATMTCHSMMDHPDLGPQHGTWQEPTRDLDHAFVSLLHFSADDPPLGALTGLAGWWTITWRGDTYFYHLNAGGSCHWVSVKPSSPAQPTTSDGFGHWYAGKNENDIAIAWTDGTVDQITLDAGHSSFSGTESGDPLVGAKGL